LALREAAGITQTQLAEFVGVPQGTIAFWEWSETPPRSSALPLLAKALGVGVDDLLVTQRPSKKAPIANKPGPVSDVQKVFEEVRRLPRHQQRKILETVQAIVDQYRRKAS
jgi:transcriptional regulator with XRE-family HTH domain